MSQKSLYLAINDRIEKIKEDLVSGRVSLLDVELKSLFDEIINKIDISNLDRYSSAFIELCALLEQKFQDLQKLLKSLDEDEKIIKFLNQNRDDDEIVDIFRGCWYNVFYIDEISLNFLTHAANRFIRQRLSISEIEHQKRASTDEDFILKIPEMQFVDRLDNYFIKITEKLPCNLDQIFEGENNQIKIYEQFIYLLHLLQLGRIKYHTETKMFYL